MPLEQYTLFFKIINIIDEFMCIIIILSTLVQKKKRIFKKNTYENIGFKGLISIFGYFDEVEMDCEGIFSFVLFFSSKK